MSFTPTATRLKTRCNTCTTEAPRISQMASTCSPQQATSCGMIFRRGQFGEERSASHLRLLHTTLHNAGYSCSRHRSDEAPRSKLQSCALNTNEWYRRHKRSRLNMQETFAVCQACDLSYPVICEQHLSRGLGLHFVARCSALKPLGDNVTRSVHQAQE